MCRAKEHGHFDGPALCRPAQGGDGGLLGDLNLHVRSAAPFLPRELGFNPAGDYQ